MDLPNIETYQCPLKIADLNNWNQETAWLAGGTWLFSEPQPHLKVLVDMQALGWSEIGVVSFSSPSGSQDYLAIGATCPLIKLLQYPWLPKWTAVDLLKSAVCALAASLKVINIATVGGNICLALSVGTLAPVMVALNAIYEIWNLSGKSRQVAAADFQIGARKTILQPGEVLRRVLIPLPHLKWKVNYQRFGIAASDPALAIVVCASDRQPNYLCWRCVIGASVAAPRLLKFDGVETQNFASLLQNIDFIEDARASSAYRRQITQVLMQRSLSTLSCNNP